MIRKFYDLQDPSQNAGGGEEKEPAKNKITEWREELHQNEPEEGDNNLDKLKQLIQTPVDKDKAADFIKSRTESVKKDENPANGLTGAIVDAKYGEEIHEKIKNFRVAIDSLYLTAFAMSNMPFLQSRELSIAVTDFQRARQFCGKILQERGAVYPYTPDTTQQVDQGSVIVSVLKMDKSEDKIMELREKAQDVITDFGIFGQNSSVTGWTEFVSHISVMQHLLAGKMALGELYAKLKNEAFK